MLFVTGVSAVLLKTPKRRATIRHGYALLCEEVPSLRLAIAAAEADEAEQAMDGEGRRRRRSRGRASTADGERVDGRAGPRSESVVLVKSTDCSPISAGFL